MTRPFNRGQTVNWVEPSDIQLVGITEKIEHNGWLILTEQGLIEDRLANPWGFIGAAYGATGHALRTNDLDLMRAIIHQHDMFDRVRQLRSEDAFHRERPT
jgi:hypothetical protein